MNGSTLPHAKLAARGYQIDLHGRFGCALPEASLMVEKPVRNFAARCCGDSKPIRMIAAVHVSSAVLLLIH